MRCKWEFHFETHAFQFARNHKFRGVLDVKSRSALGLQDSTDCFYIYIEPDEKCKFPLADQTGKMFVEIAGDREDTENAVKYIIANISQRLSFEHQGTFKVHTGLVIGERIPESEEERSRVGGAPYFAEMHLEEYIPPAIFRPSSLSSVSTGGSASAAIRQYNSATQAANAIDQMIGYFKVLECLYLRAGKDNAFMALRSSQELKRAAEVLAKDNGNCLTDQQYEAVIRDIVRVRGSCAHLRANGAAGYLPGTEKIRREVEPVLDLAKKLAWTAIALRLEAEQAK